VSQNPVVRIEPARQHDLASFPIEISLSSADPTGYRYRYHGQKGDLPRHDMP
jgi:hypothetical protein